MAVAEIRVNPEQMHNLADAARRVLDGNDQEIKPIQVLGQPFVIPMDDEFEDRAFLDWPNLSKLARAIRAKHPREFAHIDQATVVYLWKRKGGSYHKTPVLGHTVQPSGLAKHFAGADFVIWLAADHLRELWLDGALTPAFVEALLVHEHFHIGQDLEGMPTIVDHDFQGFTAEIAISGFWQDDLRALRAAVQPRLFEDEPAAPLPLIDPETGEIREDRTAPVQMVR